MFWPYILLQMITIDHYLKKIVQNKLYFSKYISIKVRIYFSKYISKQRVYIYIYWVGRNILEKDITTGGNICFFDPALAGVIIFPGYSDKLNIIYIYSFTWPTIYIFTFPLHFHLPGTNYIFIINKYTYIEPLHIYYVYNIKTSKFKFYLIFHSKFLFFFVELIIIKMIHKKS